VRCCWYEPLAERSRRPLRLVVSDVSGRLFAFSAPATVWVCPRRGGLTVSDALILVAGRVVRDRPARVVKAQVRRSLIG
jgi:hypothetical protein